jgi:hypothetical protein
MRVRTAVRAKPAPFPTMRLSRNQKVLDRKKPEIAVRARETPVMMLVTARL